MPGNDSPPHSITVANGTAIAAPAIAGALQALLAHDVAAWPEHGFELVKARPVRAVFRGALDGVPVYLKVYRADTLADRVRDLVRPDRGAAECANLRRLADAGLPAVEPLAHGLARAGDERRSFVVTRAVAGRQFACVGAPGDAAFRVGNLLRTLHDRGFFLGDLHPGNLLIDEAGRPWLLDPAKLRQTDALDLESRARALAMFCHQLDGGALDRAAATLLAGYLAAGPLPAAFRDHLARATHRWRAGALPAFGRRALRPCRHTDVPPRVRGEPRWHWHLPAAAEPLRTQCRSIASALPPPTKTGRRGSVWLLDGLVVKQREAGRARKAWRTAYWLLFARVPTATPVALRLHGGTGLLFAQRVPNDDLAAELRQRRLDAGELAAAARQLGEAIGRLHAHGLGNRDLKFENLVRDPATGIVRLVDLDGVRRRPATDSRGRGADLGRLLAAFRAAGAPGGAFVLRTFLRGYLRSWRTLLQEPPLRRLLRRAEQRAGEWAAAHR